MKKNLFTIAVLLVCMLLMTACQVKEAETPSPTVPAATIPVRDSETTPIATSVPEPTVPSATTTPESTGAVQ